MAETFQDLFFSKERDRGAIPFKEYLMIKENMEKVVGNANYATKLIKEVFEQLPETKDFITCNPYVNSTTNSHLIPNYASKVLHNGTIDESIEIRVLDFDRNGYMNSLYVNESAPTMNINTVFRKIKNGLDEKLSIGECNYDPNGISIIIPKKDLIAPEITNEQKTTPLQEFFFKKDKQNQQHDPSEGYISQEDYNRIKREYGNKNKLPNSNSIDQAAFIICGYKLEDFKKFTSEKDTKDYVSTCKSENVSQNKLESISKGNGIAIVYDNNTHNVTCFYSKNTNKLYWIYDDDNNLENGTGIEELIQTVKLYLESDHGIDHFEPYKNGKE